MVGFGMTIQLFPEGKTKALEGCGTDRQHQGKNPGRPLPVATLAKHRGQESEVALGLGCR